MAGTYKNHCSKCHKVFGPGDKAVATTLIEVTDVCGKSRERAQAHHLYSHHRGLTCLKCAEEK